jgi:flavin reductase (DIM6/NTAB) family NADH-FMN oxidoreductase RutF
MTLSRLAAALAGLVLPVLLVTTADAAPRHHGTPASVTTNVTHPARLQLVSRHRAHHRRHYSHPLYRHSG